MHFLFCAFVLDKAPYWLLINFMIFVIVFTFIFQDINIVILD